MGKNNKLQYRVDQLEKRQERIINKIDELLTNHLPHLTAEMVSLKTRISVLTAVNIGAVIFALIINKFL